jgi:hypothetical protein
MPIEVLDPTYGDDSNAFTRAERTTSLTGLKVGVISNGKKNTEAFFDALAAELKQRHAVAEVVRVTKANYSAPAGAEIMSRAREWNALVAGVGD